MEIPPLGRNFFEFVHVSKSIFWHFKLSNHLEISGFVAMALSE